MWDMFAAPEVREEDDVPSVYVDRTLLQKSKDLDVATSDVDRESACGEWKKFNLYAEKIKDENTDHLIIKLERVTHGYLINSSVFLTEHQWHSVIFKDVKTMLCVVCDYTSVLAEIKSHIEGSEHKRMMETHQPLRCYDMSITRKIQNKLHCGVCNEIIELANEDAHYSSKTHESNALFAINKASDITYDRHKQKTDCYHFTDNAVSSGVNTLKGYSNARHNSDNEKDNLCHDKNEKVDFDLYKEFNLKPEDFVDYYEFEGPSYANIASKPKVIDNMIEKEVCGKKVMIKTDSWNMIVSPKPNIFYCMACTMCDRVRCKGEHILSEQHLAMLKKCCMVEGYEEFIVRQVNTSLYHCGFCNNLQFKYSIEQHVKEKHKKSIKNVIETSTSKKVTQKAKSAEKSKITKTNEATYKTVTESQPATPKKTKQQNNTTKSDAKNTEKVQNTKSVTQNTNGVTQIPKGVTQIPEGITQIPKGVTPIAKGITQTANNVNRCTEMHNRRNVPGIFDNIDIYPFGYQITISMLSYNVVRQRDDLKFYCGLCNIICREDVIKLHIFESGHLHLLQNTPFVSPFSCNLIRGIREALHCAICNIPILPRNVYTHNASTTHVQLLNKAIGYDDPKNQKLSNNLIHVTLSPNSLTHSSPNYTSNGVNPPVTSNSVNSSITSTGVNSSITSNSSNLSSKTFYNNPSPTSCSVNDNSRSVIPSVNTPESVVESVTINDSNMSAILDNDVNKSAILENDVTDDENEFNSDDFEGDVMNESDDVSDVDDEEFDLEELVYVKLKKTYVKITNSAYNSLVPLGDGTRFCFICSQQEFNLQKHVESRPHLENIDKYRFLDRYEDHLIRQIFLMYHCAICNVIIPRKHLKTHLYWPTHEIQLDNTHGAIKNKLQNGLKQISVTTQKENIYLNEKETQTKILHYICVNNGDFEIDKIKKLGKVVIFKGTVYKLTWDVFNGLANTKAGLNCIICQSEVNSVDEHVKSEWHRNSLKLVFEKAYDSALIRKINDTTLNCVTCNIELPNKDVLINEHLLGKKHIKTYESIVDSSAKTDTFSDCDDNIFIVD